MPKSPEQFYDQHRKDAERVEKAQSTYGKHLEEAREAGDLTKHPELWDQASAEYQAEAKEKIAEAVKVGNYDVAEELIRGLRAHLDTNKEIEERGKREGLDKDEWEIYQTYRKRIESLITEISNPLTKKKMLRRSALLFDKTGSTEYLAQQQMIECALLAMELEKAANQKGVSFSISSFRNPKEAILTKSRLIKITFIGLSISLILLGVYMYLLRTHSVEFSRTIVFNLLILSHLALAFILRGQSPFKINKLLIFGTLIILIMQLFVTSSPFFRSLLSLGL